MQIPGYKIEDKIGEGGSSEVFRALRLADNRVVALKLLHKKYSEDTGMRRRLLREAKIISGLDHRNVVRIYKYGMLDERIYMFLQYLDRGSLADYGKMNDRTLLKTMVQICDGVGYIHAQEIVHRDLKPSNIMFGADDMPRLVDFGISLFSNQDYTRLTHTNMVMGTLSYMSPEQQSDPSRVDSRTDIYSLGAILYEIFTNQKPVGRFENPSDLRSGFNQELEGVILKAMARIDARYEHVSALQEDLVKLWQDGLFETGADSTLESFDNRIGRWIRTLKTGSVHARIQAQSELINGAIVEDVPQLISICVSSGQEVRAALIPVLGRLKQKEALPFLLAQIGNPMLSKATCYALVEIGGEAALKRVIVLVKKKEVFSYSGLVPLMMLSKGAQLKLVLPYLKSSSYAERKEALKAVEMGADLNHTNARRFLKDIKKYLKSEREKDLANRAYILVQKLDLA